MKTTSSSFRKLTAEQRRELKALAEFPEKSIDVREIPEVLDWSGARRGLFYRPVKQQITLRIDSDVVAWFRRNAPKGYQTNINRALREYVKRRERQAG